MLAEAVGVFFHEGRDVCIDLEDECRDQGSWDTRKNKEKVKGDTEGRAPVPHRRTSSCSAQKEELL